MKRSNQINSQINSLRKTRSSEFNKPKAKNLIRNQFGKLLDKREPRDEAVIKDCTTQINELKATL